MDHGDQLRAGVHIFSTNSSVGSTYGGKLHERTRYSDEKNTSVIIQLTKKLLEDTKKKNQQDEVNDNAKWTKITVQSSKRYVF